MRIPTAAILRWRGILMSLRTSRIVTGNLLIAWGLMAAACAERRGGAASPDPELANRGKIEVTARLVEIPEGAIFERELYNYATVLKYEVLEVHRGKVKGHDHLRRALQSVQAPIRSGRSPRAGRRRHSQVVQRAGDVHRMALEESMLDHFTGGILNKYAEEDIPTRSTGPSGRFWSAVDRPCATSRFMVSLAVRWPG